MNTLIVASTRPYAGKSGLCLSLLGMLADRSVRAGYFKPYGTMPVTVDGVLTDQDAAYIAGKAPIRPPIESVCPVVETPHIVEDLIGGRTGDAQGLVRSAFRAASEHADAMVVEGTSELAQGATFGIHLCAMAELLDARVLLVDRPEHVSVPDPVIWASECLGQRLIGVVFNAVPEQLVRFARSEVAAFLAGRGIPTYGVIGHDPLLSSVSVAEIVESLGATVLSAEGNLDMPVESFMVGAMGQEKALRFFRRKARKAVITGGDRADVQLAALETDTRCIVLTGNLPPSGIVLSRAEELGVPMLLVEADTLSTVEAMEGLLGRVRLHDPVKAARMREMFETAADTDALMAAAYGL